MKIFPWEWGHWLIFSSSFVQCPSLSRVEGGGGAGIYFDWCIILGKRLLVLLSLKEDSSTLGNKL